MRDTAISYADSTCSPMRGCSGCELWQPRRGVRICYAHRISREPGFESPSWIGKRLDEAIRWSDLTGKERTGRPWLGKMPRLILISAMGDLMDWERDAPHPLVEHLEAMGSSPHQWLLLTKRPSALQAFSVDHPLPPNIWPGTTVTSRTPAGIARSRIDAILQVEGGGPCWLSLEPMESAEVDQVPGYELFDWIVWGGQSGPGSTPCRPEVAQAWIDACARENVPLYIKQLGGDPNPRSDPASLRGLLVRQYPKISFPLQGNLFGASGETQHGNA